MREDEGVGREDHREEASFEALVEELDGIVGKLETGELSLQDSLKAFERGVQLSGQASAILDSAERRIEKLTGSPQDPQIEPFE